MENYVVVMLQGDYGDYLDTVQVQAESVEQAKKQALAGQASDTYVECVIKGEFVFVNV